MLVGLRALAGLLFGVLLLQFGNGLQLSLIGVAAAKAAFAPSTTGLITSAYSLGLLISALTTSRLVARVGHIRVFAAYASIVSTAVLLMPIWVNPAWWFVLRLVTGLCMAGLYIVTESWLNAASSNQDRGKMLSLYMIISFAALGLGNGLLNVADASGFVRFIIVSALISLSLVPVSLTPAQQPEIATPRPVSIADLYRTSPLAAIATFANGLGQSVLFSLGAVYALLLGLSVKSVSIMLALPPLAVIVSQYPVGALSDRYDRRLVLVGLGAASAGIATVMAVAGPLSEVQEIVLFAVFGAIALPSYSLALAHANDYLEPDQMVGASATLVLIFGVGAIIGPLIAGPFMDRLGAAGFFVFLAGVYGAMAIFGVYRMVRRPETPEETAEIVQVTPQAMPVALGAIAEEFGDALSEDNPASGAERQDGDDAAPD